jgi:hypothetical protein
MKSQRRCLLNENRRLSMRKGRSGVWSMLIVVTVVSVYGWPKPSKAQVSTDDKAIIRGTVRDHDKIPLYGISVRAKAGGKNSTTFVFTDVK